jgi:FAD/FMN-containing dehydrogenase/Fe-S oxidoreductase
LTGRFRKAIDGEFRADPMTLGLYSTDASIYQVPPVGVVFPKSTADVLATLEIARHYGIPLVPRGGGTSLSGQSIGPGFIVDFSRHMREILEIDTARGLARVQPGVVLDQFNAALKPLGMQFGPDVATSSRANLGGMIGNNSAGSRSVRQGKVIDHVRELEVCLSDGTVLRTGPLSADQLAGRIATRSREGELLRTVTSLVEEHRTEILRRYPRVLRRVSGYNLDELLPELREKLPRAHVPLEMDRQWSDRSQFNLSRLLVGAEGTLGVVTEAVVHIVPLPKERRVVALEFATIGHALEATRTILECEPSAVELLDRNIVELSRQNLKYRKSLDFVRGTPEAILIVEFSGDRPEIVADLAALLDQRLAGCAGLTEWHRADSPERREALWNCRKAGAPLLLSIPGARKPIAFVEDTAVDPSKMPEFTRRFRTILDRHGLNGAYYGHASVGCLHIRPMVDTKSAEDLVRFKRVSDEVADLVLEFGGAMSGEHGDGLARSYHNLKLFGPKLFEAFRAVKQAFDPAGLLNPGKVAASPSPIENLRYGTAYRPLPVHEHLDFSREATLADAPGLGFLAAAEMCNGSGVCRKTGSGTMCPSYMATRDEEHSPRGRANALRLALSGQFPEGALHSDRMKAVFDLCLMCKACKSECPSNVDVAKLKVEFFAHRHEQRGAPLASRLLGNVAWLNRLGAWTAPLSNVLPYLPIVREVVYGVTGGDLRRTLPRFERRHFARWFDSHKPDSAAGSAGRVVLLDDCLTSYCEPGVNRSATRLLEAAGWSVTRADLWCCGRPLLSKGLVEPAKTLARRNVRRLLELAGPEGYVVGTEPSCLLTLVDEYPDLVPSAAARELRDRTLLVDEFLAEPSRGEGLRERLASAPESTAVLHGHCQQKALRGTGGTKGLLAMVPGLAVREVDAGCCGMAGSFGYEHYDVSQTIGERVLFPAVRDADAGTIIVAPGFSCRHQIADGTRRRARHPVEVVAEQMGE